MNPASTSTIARIIRRARRELGLPLDPLEKAVRLFGRAHPTATFVQIGANDGVARDPLRLEVERRRWTGVMVEPVPYVFKRLEERYGNHPRVRLEMCAIAEEPGLRPFYHVREAAPGEAIWPWYHALGSFKREVLLSHASFIPDIENRVSEVQVPCVTFNDLCVRSGLPYLDLLQVDTEGYDYEVLRSVDFEAWRPRFVMYEHHHLATADRCAARKLLTEQGYLTFEHGLDTAALDSTRLGPEDETLRRLFINATDQPTKALDQPPT